MATIIKTEVATRRIQLDLGLGESSSTRTDRRIEYGSSGSKSSGSWLTFSDGSKFRRATPLTKFSSRIGDGSPQVYVGKRTDAAKRGQPSFEYQTAGGMYGDNLIANATCADLVNGRAVTNAMGPPTLPTLMRNEAVTNALLELADQKAGLGEDLATLGQTIRLIRNPAELLYRSLRGMKDARYMRRFLSESFRSLKRKGIQNAVAEEYLKYVYGWRPLMQDIYGLVEYAKEIGVKPLLLHSRGKSQSQAQIPDFSFTEISHKSGTTFRGGSELLRANCSLWAQIDPNWSGNRALNQLGLLNPASLVWELVTWSFVVDWFVPIGPVLSALSAPAGLKFVDGTTSIRAKANAYLENWGTALEALSINWSTTQKATATWTYDGYSRSTLSDWPLPGFWYNTDPLGLDTNSDRPMKALALSIAGLKNVPR